MSETEGLRTGRSLRALDPVVVQYRAATTDGNYAALFVFNTGDYPVQRTYPLSLFGLSTPYYISDWNRAVVESVPVDQIELNLALHEGRLLFLSREPFAAVPDALP